MNAIFKRRSIRKYKEQSIEKEKVEKLLRAAMQAPSAGNQQPWEFIVVEKKETLRKLSEVSPYSKLLANAPIAIIPVGNMEGLKYPEYWEQDMAAATQNILLEAVDQGLGSVWMGIAPEEDRMNYVKDIFVLEENLKPFAIIAIGYPEGNENEFIDRFDSKRVHYEKY